MKHVFTAALVAGIALGAIAPAFADDDGECPESTPADQWMSEAKVKEVAAAQGWTVKGIKQEDGCWEVKGTDAGGKRIEAYLHPTTGEVVKIKD